MNEDFELLFKSNADKVNKSITLLTKTVGDLGKQIGNNSKQFNGANKNLNKFGKALRNINGDANRTMHSMRGLTKSINLLGTGFLFSQIAKFTQSSLDTIETVNLFSNSMGNLAEETDKTLKSMSELTGLDLNQLREASASYNLLATSMGITEKNAQILSTTTTRLALDLSSLMNVPIEQVLADLRSGLVGQTETVYKYGADLTEANLQQVAYQQGIEKSTRTMSQGEKMQLRYIALLQATATAHGDFAKTIETPANQLRILGERVVTLGRSIGSVFINSLSGILPYLNAVVKGLNLIVRAIAKLIGFKEPEVTNIAKKGGGLGVIKEEADAGTKATEKLKKELKDTVLGFDEFHTVQKENKPLSAGGGGGEDLFGGDLGELPTYDSMLDQIRTKTDDILDKMLAWLGLKREMDGLSVIPDGYIDQLNKAMQDGNWYKVGYTIAEMINDGVVKAIDVISWDNIGEKLEPKIKAIANTINGFLGNEKLFANTGKLIGEALTTAINSSLIFIKELDFQQAGRDIALFFSNAIDSINWENIGRLLVVGFTRMLEFLASAILNIDWSKVVEALIQFFKGVLSELFNWFITVDTSPATALAKSIVKSFLAIKGINVLSGIGQGFKVFETVTKSLQSGVDTLFLKLLYAGDGLTKIGGVVQSLGTVFTTILGGLISPTGVIALFIGMVALIGTTIYKNWDKISTKLHELKTSFETNFPLLSNCLKTLSDDSNEQSIVVNDNFDSMNNGQQKLFEDWTTNTNTKMDEIGVKMSEKLTGWLNNIKQWIEDVKTKWNEYWENVKTTFSTKWNEIVAWWDESGVKKWIDEHVAKYFTYDYWYQLLTGTKTSIEQIFKDAFNGVLSTVEKAVNWMIDKINELSWTVPDWVDGIGGKTFGFNFEHVQFDRLARGGMLSRGDLFEAGENGKRELIGSHRGRTTVMPLEDSGFVEAIYKAVYSAVSSAQSNGGQIIENILNLDGEVIYKNQEKVKANKGINFNLGAFTR